MKTFEDFVAGDDRLAALLRALPIFEAPAEMAVRFAAHAHAAQAVHAKDAALSFAPPASMEANFLAEAARIQAAQQPRQDAVLRELQAGKPAAEVLGHDVAAATAAWLAARPERLDEAQAAQPPRKLSRWHKAWLPRLGLLATSAIVGSVATHLWLAQKPAPSAVASVQQDAERQSFTLPPTVVLEPIEITQLRHASKTPPIQKADLAQARQRAATMEAEAKKESAETPLAQAANELGHAGGAVPESQRQEADGLAKPSAALAKRAAPLREEIASAAVPPERRALMRSAAPAAPVVAAMDSAPEPAKLADKLAAPVHVRLSSAASEAVRAWQAAYGQDAVVLRIYAKNPASEAVQSWVERFRQALVNAQGSAQIYLERDEALSEDVLRLVRE